jgi:hypothetical protein
VAPFFYRTCADEIAEPQGSRRPLTDACFNDARIGARKASFALLRGLDQHGTYVLLHRSELPVISIELKIKKLCLTQAV